MQRLIKVQSALKAPKNQRNNFGGYNFRSCEDILEAVKPLLEEQGLLLTLSDEPCEVGGRIYVKATATIIGQQPQFAISVNAYAREEETKKGMDVSQITGSTSSYARKYALNGLFLIDDTKDADTNEQAAQGHADGRTTAPKGNKTKQSKTTPQKAAGAVSEVVQSFNAWIRDNPSKRMDVHQWCNEQFGEGYALTESVAAAALDKFNQ